MSNTAINQFLARGTTAERLAFTPDPAPAAAGLPEAGCLWWDTDLQTEFAYDFGLADWVATGGGGSGTVTNTGTLTSGALIVGNSGVDVSATTTGTGIVTALGVNVGSAGAPVLFNGALGTPSSGTLTNCTFPTALKTRAITLAIDGGGSAISTGIKADIYVPYACTITAVTMLADQSGSIVVDIWKDAYANYPPTIADTITASAKPTISTATKSTDSTLTGWTTSISAGDTLRFNVDSAATVTRLQLALTVVV